MNPEITDFDCSVFDGKYIAGGIDSEYLSRLAASRNEQTRANKGSDSIIDLHNDEELA